MFSAWDPSGRGESFPASLSLVPSRPLDVPVHIETWCNNVTTAMSSFIPSQTDCFFPYHAAIHQVWSCTSRATGHMSVMLRSDWTPAQCWPHSWQPLRCLCEVCVLQCCCCSWLSPRRQTFPLLLLLREDALSWKTHHLVCTRTYLPTALNDDGAVIHSY